MNRSHLSCAFLGATVLSVLAISSAQQPTSAPDANKGKWTNFTDAFNKASGNAKGQDNFRLALAVDRATGNLFVSRWFTGVWMSSDKAETFTRADGGKITAGGPFSCYAMIAHPEGGKLAAFNMNNKPGPCGYSLDGGKHPHRGPCRLAERGHGRRGHALRDTAPPLPDGLLHSDTTGPCSSLTRPVPGRPRGPLSP